MSRGRASSKEIPLDGHGQFYLPAETTLNFQTNHISKQGCGVGVETGVGVGRSGPFWPESESELEPVKFCRLRLRPGIAGHHPSTDGDFGRTVMHHLGNIEKNGKKSGSAEIKLGRHLVIARTGAVGITVSYHLFECSGKWNQENRYVILLFLG